MPKSTCALSLPNHYLAAGLGVHLQVRGDCGDGVLDLEEVALHLGRVRVRARARVRVRDKVRVRVRVSRPLSPRPSSKPSPTCCSASTCFARASFSKRPG